MYTRLFGLFYPSAPLLLLYYPLIFLFTRGGKVQTARKIFERCLEVKELLGGGEFWTRGYYVESVGEHGDEQVIQRYVKNQGRKPEEYQKIHEGKQLEPFPYQNKA
ncbi:MAG: transposase [Treponema sp.]|nr:transposase [Treponema sp.]